MSLWITLFSMLAIMLIVASGAQAGDQVVIADFSSGILSSGGPAGWALREKSGKADFTVVKDGDIVAGRFRSTNTSFSLQKKVKVDLAQYPVLTWTWKVTELPSGGDFRQSETDDQPAQLYVLFPRTKAIVYLWDATAPQGFEKSTSPIPFMTDQVVVVRSGSSELGKWITESRNVYEDYKKIFGSEAATVNGIMLQINSQHTKTSCESYFADIVFRRQRQSEPLKTRAGLTPRFLCESSTLSMLCQNIPVMCYRMSFLVLAPLISSPLSSKVRPAQHQLKIVR